MKVYARLCFCLCHIQCALMRSIAHYILFVHRFRDPMRARATENEEANLQYSFRRFFFFERRLPRERCSTVIDRSIVERHVIGDQYRRRRSLTNNIETEWKCFRLKNRNVCVFLLGRTEYRNAGARLRKIKWRKTHVINRNVSAAAAEAPTAPQL